MQALPLSIDSPLRAGLGAVQVAQAAWLALVSRDDGLLRPALLVTVVGDDAGVVAAGVVGQVADQVLGQLAFQLQAGDVAAVGAEAVLHIAAVPDDRVYLRLHALQGVGQLRDQVRPASGEHVAERGAATLQAVPLGAGSAQGALAVAVGVAQVLQVVALGTGDGFLLLRAVHVVEVRAHAVVAVAVGLQVAVLVAILAGEDDVRQRQAAGSLAAAGRQAEQAAGFHGGHRIEVLAQAGQQVGV